MIPPTSQTVQQIGDPAHSVTVDASSVQGRNHPSGQFGAGTRIGDFELIRELGRGGFASVYLARQLTLDRLVALKFSSNRGLGEGQALAGLEHDHIVKVYSEFVDPVTQLHCLCLQYVPGTSLYALIKHLYRHGQVPHSGQELLVAVDQLSTDTVGFDPSSLPNREILRQGSFAEAVAWIGIQLAQALSFAHARNILHCDIKPGNILVNRYGRPMLVDFNVAMDAQCRTGLGGTLDYMAPENLDAIGSQSMECVIAPIDARSDIYSLGLVLFELATGKLPFPAIGKLSQRWDLIDVAKSRQTIPHESLDQLWAISPALARVIQRCLEYHPNDRYQNGMELAEALGNTRELIRIERKMPAAGTMSSFAQRHLLIAILFVTLLPNCVASVLQIFYNTVEVKLSPTQQRYFPKLVLYYNLIVYPLCIYLMTARLLRFFSHWRRLDQLSNQELNALRTYAMGFPRFTVMLASLGWFPGGILFPIILHQTVGPMDWKVALHLMISFVLSGLVAVVYSFFGIQWVILRVVYPPLDHPDRDRGLSVMQELHHVRRWLEPMQILAGLVPLCGAILLVILADDELTLSFRLLVTSLIVLGMLGLGFAVRVSDRLQQLLQILGETRAVSTLEESTSAFIDIRKLKLN